MEYSNLDVNIRDVQKVQLEILIELDRICKKYNIKYQLFSGTLLGAVRHKGFIPWDDDIDVCLLREDYNKLLEICDSELDSKYFLQNYNTDKNCILQFSKLRKNNTIFRSESYKDSNIHQGIFIDIFPMDNIETNTMLGRLHPKLFNFMFIITTSMDKSKCYNAKTPLRRFIRLGIHYISKILPKNSIDKLATKVACMFNSRDTKYIAHLTNGVSKGRIEKFIREKSTFYDTIDWEFEGHKFPIPRNYHEVLTKHYEDYMELPPMDKRYPHHGIIEINFNTKNTELG